MSHDSITITETLTARSQYEYYKPLLAESDFARGMYSRARLRTKSRGAILCVFTDKDGKYQNEVFLSRDYLFPDWIVEKVLYYSEEFHSRGVFIAQEDTGVDIEALCSAAIYIFDRLETKQIELIGSYLVSAGEYIDLLPERNALE